MENVLRLQTKRKPPCAAGRFVVFYRPFCGLGLENPAQGTDRLPAREGRATVATAAFGFALCESVRNYHKKAH